MAVSVHGWCVCMRQMVRQQKACFPRVRNFRIYTKSLSHRYKRLPKLYRLVGEQGVCEGARGGCSRKAPVQRTALSGCSGGASGRCRHGLVGRAFVWLVCTSETRATQPAPTCRGYLRQCMKMPAACVKIHPIVPIVSMHNDVMCAEVSVRAGAAFFPLPARWKLLNAMAWRQSPAVSSRRWGLGGLRVPGWGL